MKISAILLLIGMGLGLGGCQTTQLATESGRPEVTIHNAKVEVVKTALVNREVSKGWSVTNDTPFLLQMDKPNDSLMAQMLFGSNMNGTPNGRVVFTFAQIREDVRVVADLMIVTNPGTAFEKKIIVNQGVPAENLQQMLTTELPSEVNSLKTASR